MNFFDYLNDLDYLLTTTKQSPWLLIIEKDGRKVAGMDLDFVFAAIEGFRVEKKENTMNGTMKDTTNTPIDPGRLSKCNNALTTENRLKLLLAMFDLQKDISDTEFKQLRHEIANVEGRIYRLEKLTNHEIRVLGDNINNADDVHDAPGTTPPV